jgi:exosortase E/protease (VPEID-CTERM system)
LLARLYLLAAVLALDCAAVASIPHSASLLGPIAPAGILGFAIFLGLGRLQLKSIQEKTRFNIGFFAFHLVCILAVVACNFLTLHGYAHQLDTPAGLLSLRILLILGLLLLTFALIPASTWIKTLRTTHPLGIYALSAGFLAWALRSPVQSLWSGSSSALGRTLQSFAFQAVHALLRPILPQLAVDPATFSIGTPNFSILIAEQCSGLEGLGLVLVFTAAWLGYFRKESRFPQALLLVPCALICVWSLNIVRIAALVLIGDAGAPDVAMVGFHSQAGWIAFTSVAFAFSMATRKLAWVRRIPEPESSAQQPLVETSGESPATGAYLVPFLAILAATFISKAASGYFEWLYPLRFVAAAAALWYFRPVLKKLDWRFDWTAPVAGSAVFLLWIAPTLWSGLRDDSTASVPLGVALQALSPAARITWIAFRVAAAVITVPIAEELAFRGYLSRRLMNREFDTVPFRSLGILAVGLSSVAFGCMHGQHWLVGILAGLAYAVVLKRRGRIGDAVVAHAVSNLLLAVWVLARGDWSQW